MCPLSCVLWIEGGGQTSHMHGTMQTVQCCQTTQFAPGLSQHDETSDVRGCCCSAEGSTTASVPQLANFPVFACLCNPCTTTRSVTHICPLYRQLSMQAVRLDDELIIPWLLDDTSIRTSLALIESHPAHPIMHQYLKSRDFVKLWTDPICFDLLRSTCILCG